MISLIREACEMVGNGLTEVGPDNPSKLLFSQLRQNNSGNSLSVTWNSTS